MKHDLYLLSGLLCDQTIWGPVQVKLDDVANVQALDFRGFDDIGAMAEYVLDIATDGFALAGHSLGARVALEVCRRAPGRVDRLALLSTGVHPAKPGEQQSRQRLIDIAYNEGMEALAKQWLGPMLLPANRANAQCYEPLLAMVLGMTPVIYQQQAHALLNRPDAFEQLSAIQCPTLVGVGRQDEWSPIAQHELIVGQMPKAKLCIFENSGHMAPFEVPDQVGQALREWLR
jgi:pimeloyl-ACP methyl ester carboxylesterase